MMSLLIKGAFNNHFDKIFLFFDNPPIFVEIFYVQRMDKNGK